MEAVVDGSRVSFQGRAMDTLPLDLPVTDDRLRWVEALWNAFEDQQAHPLPMAEQALRECPGDGTLYHMAALAALLESQPDRCLLYLKRFSKRFVPDLPYQLLRALALAQQGRYGPAAALLQRHGLSNSWQASYFLPGGPSQRVWLKKWLAKIRANAQKTSPTGKAARRGNGKAPGRIDKSPPPPQPKVAEDLPLPAMAIPVRFEMALDGALAPTASEEPAWFRLRSELVHLGLLKGFDELLCLPGLRDVDTYWYQVETVRKVLKQFRGRVLLADEVGLGKTVEAGMVVKEYLLRGMAERVLILTPASLVGQWREEMAVKFDIPCLTSHDPFCGAIRSGSGITPGSSPPSPWPGARNISSGSPGEVTTWSSSTRRII